MTVTTATVPDDVQLDEPRYLLGTTAHAAGISSNLLKAWVSRTPPIIPLSDAETPIRGKGSSRLFTLRRVISVAIAFELTRLGVAASAAGKIAALVTHAVIVDATKANRPTVDLFRTNNIIAVSPTHRPFGLFWGTESSTIRYICDFGSTSGKRESRFDASLVIVRYGLIADRVLRRLSDFEASKSPKPISLAASVKSALGGKKPANIRSSRKKSDRR